MIFSTLEGWTPRISPLEAFAVVARGESAFLLARRLLDRSDEELNRLRGAFSNEKSASDAILAISGAFESLPWAPEAIYLGRETGAPSLLWPIHLAPPLSADLIERALRRRFPDLAVPLALVPMWKTVLPIGETLPVQRPFVTQFLAKNRS